MTEDRDKEAAGGEPSTDEVEKLRQENLALKEKLEASKKARKQRHFSWWCGCSSSWRACSR